MIQPITINELYRNRGERLYTNDDQIDELLYFIPGQITEFYGKSSTGKSTFVTFLMLQTMLPIEQGGLCGGSLCISTGKPFSLTRLEQLYHKFAHRYHLDKDLDTMYQWFDNIHLIEVRDLDTLLFLLKFKLYDFIVENQIKFISIDSITCNFRGIDDLNLFERSEKINDICSLLKSLRIVVVITSEASDNFNHSYFVGASIMGRVYKTGFVGDHLDCVAALGHTLSTVINTRVHFGYDKIVNKREIRVIFSPVVESRSLEIIIDKDGITSK
jgi:hypothetical protein